MLRGLARLHARLHVIGLPSQLRAVMPKPIRFAARLRLDPNGTSVRWTCKQRLGVLKLPARACSPFSSKKTFNPPCFTYIACFSTSAHFRPEKSFCPNFSSIGQMTRCRAKPQCPTLTRPLDAISRLDVSQWIVAHGQLSARTTLRHNWMVTPESPDRVMWTQCNPAPFHRHATNMRYQANHFKLFL